MIQKSIKGFLWIPLTEEPVNSEPSGQSHENGSIGSKDNDQSECTGDRTPVNHGDSVRPSDPPRRGNSTKSKRKTQAEKKRERKRDNLTRKCKKTVQLPKTPSNTETDDTVHNYDATLNDNDRSLTDMIASALRETPSDSQSQHVSVGDNCTPQNCVDEDVISQVISLESQLVVSRIENESASNEITRLKTVIDLLEEELTRYKKTSVAQKQEIKSLKSTNDNLRRELSHFRGMRKFTEGQNSQSSTHFNDSNLDINEQLNVTKAKLASFKDEVTNVASLMLKLLEDEHLNTDDVIDTTPFEPVMSRKHRKSPAILDSAPNPSAADMPANAQVSHGRPIPVIVSGAQGSEEVRKERTYSHILSSAPPRAASSTMPTSHRNRDTYVIGTSLTRGVGAQLAQQGVQATCFTYAGCEIPNIRGQLRHIIPKTNQPNHVILQCGGNDAEKRPAERIIGQYDSLISEVRRLCPDACISVSRIPPRRNNNTILNKIGQINAYLEQKCSRDKDLYFVDACPDSIYLYKRDLVHFNVRGTRYYSNKLKQHIQGFQTPEAQRRTWEVWINSNTCLRARIGVITLTWLMR